MTRNRKFVGLLLASLIFLLPVSCQKQKPKAVESTKKPRVSAHAIPKDESKLLMKHVREDIKVIIGVATDTASLKQALAGDALQNMGQQIRDDLEAGRIKRRQYDSIKLKISNYTQGVAGLNFDFVDKSYYVDAETKTRLSVPENKKQSFILEARKVDKRWKIFNIFTHQVKPGE